MTTREWARSLLKVWLLTLLLHRGTNSLSQYAAYTTSPALPTSPQTTTLRTAHPRNQTRIRNLTIAPQGRLGRTIPIEDGGRTSTTMETANMIMVMRGQIDLSNESDHDESPARTLTRRCRTTRSKDKIRGHRRQLRITNDLSIHTSAYQTHCLTRYVRATIAVFLDVQADILKHTISLQEKRILPAFCWTWTKRP